MLDNSFGGRFVLVAGGGSGTGAVTGAVTATRFAACCGTVVIADVDRERAETIAADLPGAQGIRLDVGDEQSVAAAGRQHC